MPLSKQETNASSQTSQPATEVYHEMWVWWIASPSSEQVYPPCTQCGIIVHPKNHKILGPAPLGNDYYRWEAVWFGIFGRSFFLLDAKIGRFAFQECIKPPVMLIGKSVMLTDNRPWEMRPPPWDHEITAETVSLMAPWELRGLPSGWEAVLPLTAPLSEVSSPWLVITSATEGTHCSNWSRSLVYSLRAWSDQKGVGTPIFSPMIFDSRSFLSHEVTPMGIVAILTTDGCQLLIIPLLKFKLGRVTVPLPPPLQVTTCRNSKVHTQPCQVESSHP